MMGRAPTTRLRIEYYGHIREQVQASLEELVTTSTSIRELLDEIQKKHNIQIISRSGVPPFVIAVNSNLIPPEQYEMPHIFHNGDIIAIMPPFSGG